MGALTLTWFSRVPLVSLSFRTGMVRETRDEIMCFTKQSEGRTYEFNLGHRAISLYQKKPSHSLLWKKENIKLGARRGITLNKKVLLSCVFWHKYPKQYHFANVKFPGRKHTLHANSCPDHSRGRTTAKPQVSISSWPRCVNEDMTRKKPHAPCPTARLLHVQFWLFPPAKWVK